MSTSTITSTRPPQPPPPPPVNTTSQQDPRAHLPTFISRFLGYRSHSAPYKPIPYPPFTWLEKIPLCVEVWIFGFLGAFVSILLIQSITTLSPLFKIWNTPLIITSFGASAILVFGVIESPLAQPQNLVAGQMLSAIVGVGITKLFRLNEVMEIGGYDQSLKEGSDIYGKSYIASALSMALTLLLQQMLGITHPPGGPTALSAAIEEPIVNLGWKYLFVVLVSSLTMLAWALIINNLGRRRYPVYWVKADGIFPFFSASMRKRQERRMSIRRSIREDYGKEAAVGGVEVPERVLQR